MENSEIKGLKKSTNCYFNQGIDTKYAFVFSVPGKLELYNNRPVVGETGVMLEKLLLLLNEDIFKSIDSTKYTNRYQFRITNSWPEPIFKSKNNSTEASHTKVSSNTNIQRLKKELEDITECIFVFGKKAELVIRNRKVKEGIRADKVIYIRHLSLSSLNQIKEDVNKVNLKKGDDSNTDKRLEVIGQDILKKYNK
jgi:hypothetical protein